MERFYTKAFTLFLLSASFAIPGKVCAGRNYVIYADTATVRLSGTVYDENKEPLAYASVALLQPQDSVLINGVVTDEQGKFLLETSRTHFLVRIEYLRYEPLYFSD